MLKRLPDASRRIVSSAASLAAARGVAIISRVLYILIITRMLGPDLYGLLAYTYSWYIVFMPIATLGMAQVIMRSVGEGTAHSGAEASTASNLMVVGNLVAAVLCGALALAVEADPQVRRLMLVFAVALGLRASVQRAEILLIAHGHANALLPVTSIIRPLEPILALLVLWVGGGLLELAFLHAALWGLQGSVILVVAKRRRVLPPFSLRDRRAGRVLLRAFPLFLALLIGGQVEQGSILLYRWTEGPQLGQVALLIQVIVVLSVIPRSIHQVLLPALARRTIVDPTHAREVGRFLVASTLIGATAAAIAARWLAPVLLAPVIGVDYLPALEQMWLSLIALGALSTALTINQQLVAQGRDWSSMASMTAGAVTLLGAFFAIMPDSPDETLLVAATAFGIAGLSAALLAGVTRWLWRPLLCSAAALAAALVTPSPWMGAIIGLGVLGLLTIVSRTAVFPRSRESASKPPAG